MTVESNYAVAIATISENLAAVFQPIRSKSKTNRAVFKSL